MTLPQSQGDKERRSGVATQGNLRRRFVSGVSWNVLGTVLAQGSVFATNLLIANQLGLQSFGEFSLLQNTALTLSAIAQVGTGATVSRYVAQYRATDPARAGRILGFCTLFTLLTGLTVSFLLFVLSGQLSTGTLNAPQLSGGLKIMAAYLLFSVMAGYQTGALTGLEAYPRIAKLGAMHAIIHIAVAFIGVWFYGLPGALWSLVISLIVRWLLHHQAIRWEARKFGIRITYVIEKDERDVLLRFSVPAALGGSTSMLAFWLVNMMLAKQPMGFLQLGLFAAALNLQTIVKFVPSIMASVGGVLLNSHFDADDRTLFRRSYWMNVGATTVAVGFAGLAVILLSNFLLSFFGEGFAAAKPIVKILVAAAFIEAVMVSLYQLVYALERMWWSYFGITVPRCLVILTFASLLIPQIGAAGLAWAHLLGSLTCLCSMIYFVRSNRGHLGRQAGYGCMDG